ncbi:hypothetical protein B0H66DRAFT_499875 [Apodospora peruviana]|uniref:Uncharacterized protein n=1 Tax=Apodospora peruviana TaxID=516989 RepID=A0AAE0M3E0_9PEZI|nr:hypothetical protein B0H66DRAFT_499875 [Apodospora peruviana]
MDQKFVARTAADMDEMADTLRRLNTSESRSSSNYSNMSSVRRDSASSTHDQRQGAQARHGHGRRVASGGNGSGSGPSSFPQSPRAASGKSQAQAQLQAQYGQPQAQYQYQYANPWTPAAKEEPYEDLYDDDGFLSQPDSPRRSSQTSRDSRRPPSAKATRKDSRASERRPSATPSYSLYPPSNPPVAKPLPPLPPLSSMARNSRRAASQGSFEATSDVETSRFSRSSRASTSDVDRASNGTSPTSPPMAAPSFPPPAIPTQYGQYGHTANGPPPQGAVRVDIVPWKLLTSNEKPAKAGKDVGVYFFDVSTSSTTLASKHGNNIIKVWSVGSGTIQNTLKVSCYTTAQARSREYFVRSHAILSEPTTMIAIAVDFGDSLEIWDWAKKKKLQAIDKADRWAAVRSNVYESAWSPLVTYRGDNDTIDLWSTTPHSKKPFQKSRTISLRNAGLPVLPKYPELAFSATGPILVAASGPRPPRLGHPPPERETLLVAWDIQNAADDGVIPSNAPYKVVAPWQHAELDTALPSGLATYGSVAVSIWIPASYRVIPVPTARGGQGFNLVPVAVPFRYVLVWDFSAASTRTFRIPNATSCVSPDCRFIAYCDASGTDVGARGNLVILDALTGRRLWVWPDPEATATQSGPRPGFEQLEDLSKVSELAFSADGGFLYVGTNEGEVGVYEVRDLVG